MSFNLRQGKRISYAEKVADPHDSDDPEMEVDSTESDRNGDEEADEWRPDVEALSKKSFLPDSSSENLPFDDLDEREGPSENRVRKSRGNKYFWNEEKLPARTICGQKIEFSSQVSREKKALKKRVTEEMSEVPTTSSMSIGSPLETPSCSVLLHMSVYSPRLALWEFIDFDLLP